MARDTTELHASQRESSGLANKRVLRCAGAAVGEGPSARAESVRNLVLVTLWTAALLGVGARLALAWQSPEAADTANYRLVAETLRRGGRLYADTHLIYPYPPPWSVVELAALQFSDATGAPFAFWARLPSVLADAAVVLLLYLLGPSRLALRTTGALLYALNPLPILVSSVHGQFDAIAVLSVLAAVYFFTAGRRYRAALALMSGIAFKAFPVLVVPVFLLALKTWRSRLAFAALATGPVAVMLAPFMLADPAALFRELFAYSGVADHGWLVPVRALGDGLATLGPQSLTMMGASKYVFLVGYAFLLCVLALGRTADVSSVLVRAVALVFAAFYVLYGGISSQYLLWLLPFLLLLDLRAAVVYSAFATVALMAFYNGIHPAMVAGTPFALVSGPTALSLWVAFTVGWWLWVLVWTVKMLRFVRRAPAAWRGDSAPTDEAMSGH